MKKINFISLVLIVILSLSIFTGCLFSDKASIKDCYTKYEEIVNKYSNDNDYILAIKANSDSFSEFYNVSALKVDFNGEYSLKNYIQSSKYSILNQELQVLLDQALLYFHNYKKHLQFSEVSKIIPQENNGSLFRSIEDYESKVNKLFKSKLELETYYRGSINPIIEEMFASCIKDYFEVIRGALNISLNTKAIIDNIVDKNIIEVKCKDAVLSTSLYSMQILVNYYEQYMDFNDYLTINSISGSLNQYYYNITSYLNNQILMNGTNFENASSMTSFVNETEKYLQDLKKIANQATQINLELGKEQYTLENDAKKYYLQERYNVLLDNDIVLNSLNNALNCLK